MRRQSAVLLLAALAAVTGLRLSVVATNTNEAMRCAIACGHAFGMTKGAACCPMTETPGSGPVLRTCSRGGNSAVAPLAPRPILLSFCERVPKPDGSRPTDTAVSATVRSAFLRAPEKVPLLLG
jgi:hypothetical protein